MAEIKDPIKIDGFKCVEDMAQAVLNYTYKEKTLKEWADSISEPQTNADRIRSMSDAEIADFLCDIGECNRRCPAKIGDCIFSDSTCRSAWLDWLKEVVKDGE